MTQPYISYCVRLQSLSVSDLELLIGNLGVTSQFNIIVRVFFNQQCSSRPIALIFLRTYKCAKIHCLFDIRVLKLNRQKINRLNSERTNLNRFKLTFTRSIHASNLNYRIALSFRLIVNLLRIGYVVF